MFFNDIFGDPTRFSRLLSLSGEARSVRSNHFLVLTTATTFNTDNFYARAPSSDVGRKRAQSGCILETLDAHLANHGCAMPLDLGAKGSCQIGGNISTNAGGLRLLRYGSLHGSILGLEVVLADGTILDLLSSNRKDNTGYALKNLFIGAEGTLGVVTRCAIAVPPRPANMNVALLTLRDFTAVERVLSLSRARLAEVLSAVEFMDKEAVALTLDKCDGVRSPFPAPRVDGSGAGGDNDHGFYVLIETSGSDATHDGEKMEAFLEAAMESVGYFRQLLTPQEHASLSPPRPPSTFVFLTIVVPVFFMILACVRLNIIH